jgi:hypothetical protein
MHIGRSFARGGMAAVLAAGAPMLLLSSAAPAAPQKIAAQTHVVELEPLNGSGVTGTATLQLRGQRYLVVTINATGLETGQFHPGHIHGVSSGGSSVDSTCPTTALDSDSDGFIELAEGIPAYGPVIVNFGNVDPDGDGTVNIQRTFDLDRTDAIVGDFDKDDLRPLEFRAIVLHGLTLAEGEGTNGGEADGTAGYKTPLPVACGVIERAGPGAMHFRTL